MKTSAPPGPGGVKLFETDGLNAEAGALERLERVAALPYVRGPVVALLSVQTSFKFLELPGQFSKGGNSTRIETSGGGSRFGPRKSEQILAVHEDGG